MLKNYIDASGRRTMSSSLAVLIAVAALVTTSTSFIYPLPSTHNRVTRLSSSPQESSTPFSKINIPNPFSKEETATPPTNPNTSPSSPNPTNPSDSNEPQTLFDRARAIISSDFKDPFLIDDEFTWISPEIYGRGLDKDDYLTAASFFNLRGAFPDLDYRAHDFRLDPNDPMTVRVTLRTVGTMRGDLRLRKEVLPANGQRMICPPETVTMTFTPTTLKLRKLTTGFTMDRLVGNTDGVCGIPAAATVGGSPPSVWDRVPLTVVFQRFFARPTKQLSEVESFLAPFPESVMVQLAKGVLAADNGASDPSLLGKDFEFCGPLVGPIGKDAFVAAFGGFKLKDAFPDLVTSYTNFRVDPFDPYRVWLDATGTGTNTGNFAGNEPTGKRFQSPPEAVSLTFDEQGVCTRLTAGAVLDPTQGNTGGLGGVFGILYAIGKPLPGVASRPLPENFARLQKRISKLVTGVDVDDYGLSTATRASTSTQSKPAVTTPAAVNFPKISIPKIEVPNIELPSAPEQELTPKPPKLPPTPRQKSEAEVKSGNALEQVKRAAAQARDAVASAEQAKEAQKEAAEKKKQQVAMAAEKEAADKKKKQDELNKKREMEAAKKEKAAVAAQGVDKANAADIAKQQKMEAAARAREEKEELLVRNRAEQAAQRQEKKEKAEAAAKEKREQAAAAALARKEAATAAARERKEKAEEAANERREKTAAAAQARKDAAERAASESKKGSSQAVANARKKKEAAEALAKQKKTDAARQKKELAAKKSNNPVQEVIERSSTFKLFFTQDKKEAGEKPTKSAQSKKAPSGVPTITKWKKNRDKTVTGLIYDSPNFKQGQKITTSAVVGGDFVSGNVVRTGSGSKYFLD